MKFLFVIRIRAPKFAQYFLFLEHVLNLPPKKMAGIQNKFLSQLLALETTNWIAINHDSTNIIVYLITESIILYVKTHTTKYKDSSSLKKMMFTPLFLFDYISFSMVVCHSIQSDRLADGPSASAGRTRLNKYA